ncbi:hypothetical protein [Fibrobacter sp. UWH4]|uniref:hypothetical protein n=1 Tax=Fibrobacter sp. UWH4 TaxID=1896210 RepID=UPI00091859FC|nr:hypothetical protein [Fibrobacter sp. UWH4]SHL32890.1 hypothetical protein SAMN05720762_105243 [Fibrobacter sp. UWH4]
MKLHEEIFIKNEQGKINHLIMQSNERNTVSFKEALMRINSNYEKALNGIGMYRFERGRFCFETGFVTNLGEKIVCYCEPNRYVKGQAFCIGFGKAATYGLDLSEAIIPKTSFIDKLVRVLHVRIF